MDSLILNIIGLSSNIIGSIILAFSLGSYISSLRLAIDAHELQLLSILNPKKPLIQVTGVDVHLNRDNKLSTIKIWFGILLLIGGFIIQIIALFEK